MDRILLVGLGGFVGSILRYLVSGYVQDWTGSASFPFGTLAVNVLGCLIIGSLTQLGEARGLLTPETRALVVIGVLGGFTTFSSFGNETLALARDGENLYALANIAANVLVGLGAVWLGRTLVLLVWR